MAPTVSPVRGSFLVGCALLTKRRRSLAAAIADSPGGSQPAGQGAEQKFSLAELKKNQRRRSRLDCCRAESSAGALDATGGFCRPPRRRRGSSAAGAER